MKKNLYFPALDGLRFFAFLWVFVGHLPRPESPLIVFQYTNWMGVDLFFVLSAFLITILLLIEYEKTQTISVKNFFIRRSLRILPLYFIVILIGGGYFTFSPM